MTTMPPAPGDGSGSDGAESLADGTLGGYFRHHDRPPAFEGPDGYPYTVSVEIEKTPDLSAPFVGFLVFPRWAKTGAGIVGHMETPLLVRGNREEVVSALETLTLQEVQDLLVDAIQYGKKEKE